MLYSFPKLQALLDTVHQPGFALVGKGFLVPVLVLIQSFRVGILLTKLSYTQEVSIVCMM
jgi:hypothetical protein